MRRLDAIVGKLGSGEGGRPPTRIIVARRGFTTELRRTARHRPDVQLVDLDQLYGR